MTPLLSIALLAEYGALKQLTLSQINTFIDLAATLRQSIQLVQPAAEPSDEAPAILPPSIIDFLAEAVQIPRDSVSVCWLALKDIVWQHPLSDERASTYEKLFVEFGWKRDISKCFNM